MDLEVLVVRKMQKQKQVNTPSLLYNMLRPYNFILKLQMSILFTFVAHVALGILIPKILNVMDDPKKDQDLSVKEHLFLFMCYNFNKPFQHL